MAALRYRDEHNKVGYLQKPKGSDDYHQVLDFLRASHIRSPELGPPAILATIDETPYTITEDSVRSQLQLADDGGIDDLPIADIYSGMDNLGTKSGSWDQFGSSLAVALICLSDGRKFNWSSYIFKGMVSNIGNAKKFLMYPRFLQTILGIETSFTRQYRVFKLSSKLFANMKLNFEGQPMQLLAAMLPQDQEGEGAGVAAQAVPPPIPEPIPEPMPEPDQPQDHLSTPPRQQTSDPIAPVFEHGQSSDPNIASFSRAHETDDEPFTSTNVEDEPLGGSFHASPPRSTQAPPAGHTSGGCGGKVGQESQSNGGKTQDQEKEAMTVNSNIPPGGASNNPAASSHIPTDVPTGGDFAPTHSTSPSRDPFKRKGVAKPSSPISERTKKQLADERLSEIKATRLEALERERSEKEKAEIARQNAIYAKQLEQEVEMSASQRETRQAEVLSSAKHYSDAYWIDIMAQVHANAGLSSELPGADVNDDNFAERMVALINQRKRAFAEQTAKEKRDKPMTIPLSLRRSGWLWQILISRTQKDSKRAGEAKLELESDDKDLHPVVSDEASEDKAPILWFAFAGWECCLILKKALRVLSFEFISNIGRLEVWSAVSLSNLFMTWKLFLKGVVHVYADVSYPSHSEAHERMLKHKLEIAKDVVGNDMTTAEQLDSFIQNQLAAAQVSPT
ncbi:hypothetical protein Tco_0544257 [Tanacetum coccineum]